MHLKGPDDLSGFVIQHVALRDVVTISGKGFLQRTYRNHFKRRTFTKVLLHRYRIRPCAYALFGKRLPGKQGAGIRLAHGGDVTVPDNILRLDGITLDHIRCEPLDQLQLCWSVGKPKFSGRPFDKTRIDDFDANGCVIEIGAVSPLTDPGVPSPFFFR